MCSKSAINFNFITYKEVCWVVSPAYTQNDQLYALGYVRIRKHKHLHSCRVTDMQQYATDNRTDITLLNKLILYAQPNKAQCFYRRRPISPGNWRSIMMTAWPTDGHRYQWHHGVDQFCKQYNQFCLWWHSHATDIQNGLYQPLQPIQDWAPECPDVKIANDGLTRSGTGCCIPIWQQWVCQRVKGVNTQQSYTADEDGVTVDVLAHIHVRRLYLRAPPRTVSRTLPTRRPWTAAHDPMSTQTTIDIAPHHTNMNCYRGQLSDLLAHSSCHVPSNKNYSQNHHISWRLQPRKIWWLKE